MMKINSMNNICSSRLLIIFLCYTNYAWPTRKKGFLQCGKRIEIFRSVFKMRQANVLAQPKATIGEYAAKGHCSYKLWIWRAPLERSLIVQRLTDWRYNLVATPLQLREWSFKACALQLFATQLCRWRGMQTLRMGVAWWAMGTLLRSFEEQDRDGRCDVQVLSTWHRGLHPEPFQVRAWRLDEAPWCALTLSSEDLILICLSVVWESASIVERREMRRGRPLISSRSSKLILGTFGITGCSAAGSWVPCVIVRRDPIVEIAMAQTRKVSRLENGFHCSLLRSQFQLQAWRLDAGLGLDASMTPVASMSCKDSLFAWSKCSSAWIVESSKISRRRPRISSKSSASSMGIARRWVSQFHNRLDTGILLLRHTVRNVQNNLDWSKRTAVMCVDMNISACWLLHRWIIFNKICWEKRPAKTRPDCESWRKMVRGRLGEKLHGHREIVVCGEVGAHGQLTQGEKWSKSYNQM